MKEEVTPLLDFPLFLGMSQTERMQLAGQTRFDFLKIGQDKSIAQQAAPCNEVYFLTSGTLSVTTRSDDGAYEIEEQINAPFLFELDALYGYHSRYAHSYRTQSECRIVRLPKNEMTRLMDDFLVIRLNVLGALSTQLQKQNRRLWHRRPENIRARMVRFFLDRSLYPAGQKTFRIRMVRLAEELGCTRLEVSQTLHQLQDEGLLTMRRGGFSVFSLERLVF